MEDDEKARQDRDDIRCDAALQTIRDVLWRFEESCEGTRTIYDVLAYLSEDLMRDGYCAACMRETLTGAAEAANADLSRHSEDAGVLH